MLTLGAFVLRLYASLGDLWLDEVWSLKLATHVSSWTEVFTKLNVENNHHLNTLWLHVLGDGLPFVVYRLHSIVAGAATVLFMALIARRWGTAASVFAAVLGSTSYLLVHYSSEARGYSVMLLAVVVSVWLALRYVKKPTIGIALAIGFVLSIGLLSQLVIALFAAVLGVWMVCVFKRWINGAFRQLNPVSMDAPAYSLAKAMGWTSLCFLLPAVTLIVLWAVNLSKIPPGGANPSSGAMVIFTALSLMIGGPHDGPVVFVAAVLMMVATLGSAWWLRRRGDLLADMTTGLIGPCVFLLPVLAVARHTPMSVRYLLPMLPLALLMLAWVLGSLWDRGGTWRRTVTLILLATYIAAQATHLVPLLRDGHGSYLAAVQYMAAQDPREKIEISSDHDFRQLTLLDYYLFALPKGKSIDYRHRNELPSGGTTWLITHAIEPAPPPLPRLQVHHGDFRLVATFPASPLSGWTWHVYRNVRK